MDSSSVSETAENAIMELGTDEMPPNTTLVALSGLNLSEMSLFRNVWKNLKDERRLQILTRLVELAENNLEYNFDAVFLHGLKDPDEDVRTLSIEGLWENEETSLIDPLIDILENDVSEKAQAAAATSLGKFAVLAEFEKLHSDTIAKVREALLGAVDDRNRSVEVARRVLEAIAPMSLPDVKDAIMDAYLGNDPGLKISAIFAMGRSYDPSWLPVLLKETKNDDPEIRYEAAGACGELEEEEAVPVLAGLVEDDDMEVRLAAIQALGKIGSISARKCLNLCLESTSDAIREAAEEALSTLDASDNPLSFHM